MIVKNNWKYKRVINRLLSYLSAIPWLLRVITFGIYIVRYLLRKMTPPKADNRGGIILNTAFNLLYVGNPKVASSTMKRLFLNDIPGSEFFLDASYNTYIKRDERSEDMFHFSFVRDPIERIYSCWKDKISTKQRAADIFIITRFKGLYPNMPFDDFVDWLCSEEGSDDYADRHWISQAKLYESDASSNTKLHLYPLNEIQAVIHMLMDKRGLTVPVSMNANQMRTSQRELASISDTTCDKIKKRYANDFALLSDIKEQSAH
ncbi:sulfotransferase family 2 domain-containing protein [Glaciecola siphonariae]|uniref:Sulfotransferase family 2 domain-containing protein n=1 Tax=Glaciecola siphonariae TaxID=521012 RepID=A0ABV9LZI3_9ALTE